MTIPTPPRRKAIPDHVKVRVLLRMLGLDGAKVEWSHEPAIALRAVNDDGTDYVPAQLDPNYIFARTEAEHARITFKDNGTGLSDITTIAKVKRLTPQQEEFRRKVLERPCGEKRQATGRWPKRGLPRLEKKVRGRGAR